MTAAISPSINKRRRTSNRPVRLRGATDSPATLRVILRDGTLTVDNQLLAWDKGECSSGIGIADEFKILEIHLCDAVTHSIETSEITPQGRNCVGAWSSKQQRINSTSAIKTTGYKTLEDVPVIAERDEASAGAAIYQCINNVVPLPVSILPPSLL